MKQLFTISITTRYDVGLIVRLAGMFLRRRIPIQSMNLTASEAKDVYHFILVVEEEEEVIRKFMLQIDKQVDVFKSSYYLLDDSSNKGELVSYACGGINEDG